MGFEEKKTLRKEYNMEKKKMLVPWMIGIFLFGFIVWGGMHVFFTNMEGNEEKVVQADGQNVENEDKFLKEAEELERLKEDKSTKAQESLIALGKRKDAVGYEANVILAERAIDKGLNPVPYYREALSLYGKKETRYKLAAVLLSQGQLQEALGEYKLLLPDEEAYRQITQIGVKPAEIGEVLLERKQWKRVIDFLKPYLAETKDENKKATLQKQYGRALGESGQYKEAVEALEPLIGMEVWDSEIQWWYGRSLEGSGQTTKAKNVYEGLGAQGAYRLGLILEKEGDKRTAAMAFGRSTEGISRWKAARLWEELGEQEKALELYLGLARGNDIHKDDAAYRAYMLTKGRKKEEAAEMLDILRKHPAWAARLKEEPLWDTVPVVSYERPDFIYRVEAYRKSGRTELADIELAIGGNLANASEKLALGDWYLEQENYYQAVLWGIRTLRETPSRRAYELTYLRPYEEEVRKAAEEFDLDPELIWAVMREESHYRPEVFSPVGAVGLMQVMPATGKDIAHRLKVSFEESDLLKPEVNIRFGAYYLRRMLNSFSQDVDKTLAAYNGGPGNVQRWSASELGKTKEGFPTAITFQETREYITKVKNTYYVYQWLYTDN
ncbi:MAG: transglycosylase SLT domain-containing protein [Thermotaleaceae bacterium]